MEFNKKDISNVLLELEKELNLMDWELSEVRVWELIRVKLFLMLQESQTGEKFDRSRRIGTAEKVRYMMQRIWQNDLLKNPFADRSYKEILVFESGRKYKTDGNFIDIYTGFLTMNFLQNQRTVQVYETANPSDGGSTDLQGGKHIDFIKHCSALSSRFIRIPYSEAHEYKTKKVEERITATLGIRCALRELISTSYRQFKSENFLYKILLKYKKPKEIYIVNYIDFFGLTAAAKELNITVTELQHGLILKEALTYHFPGTAEGSLAYFPDRFFVWEGFNHNTGKLPVSKENIISNPHNHLHYMVNSYKDVIKNNRAVIVASQPFQSLYLAEYILKSVPAMQDYIFYYKLHPMEFETFEKTDIAKQLSKFTNVNIIKNEESVYRLLKECRYIVGIYSTLLFEAGIFDCRPLILQTAHIFTSSLQSDETVRVLKPDEELKNYIS